MLGSCLPELEQCVRVALSKLWMQARLTQRNARRIRAPTESDACTDDVRRYEWAGGIPHLVLTARIPPHRTQSNNAVAVSQTVYSYYSYYAALAEAHSCSPVRHCLRRRLRRSRLERSVQMCVRLPLVFAATRLACASQLHKSCC